MSKEKLSEHINLKCCGQGMQRCAVVEKLLVLENNYTYHQNLSVEQQCTINSLECALDTQKSRNMLIEEEVIKLKRENEMWEAATCNICMGCK